MNKTAKPKLIILAHGRGDYITNVRWQNDGKAEIFGGSKEEALTFTASEASEMVEALESANGKGYSIEELKNYSDYTVKVSKCPLFYGTDVDEDDATRIAKNISELIVSQFPGINVEQWDGNVSAKTTGPDDDVVDDINRWIEDNWAAAL